MWVGAGALARGDAAINLRFPHKGYREKIWDHAAGALIVMEAGARITDASGALLLRSQQCSAVIGELQDINGRYARMGDGCLLVAGNALDFSRGRLLDLDRGIVTSTPTIHAALLKAISQIEDEDRRVG